MATHSSILAWEISWTEQPGGLQSIGSQRARYNLATEPRMAKAGPCVQCIMMCTKAGSEHKQHPSSDSTIRTTGLFSCTGQKATSITLSAASRGLRMNK